METAQIGITSAAVVLPAGRREATALLEEESVTFDDTHATRLGIETVPICDQETPSGMALAACQEALQRAELEAAQVDVIVDYSILPQEFLTPAWNLSNKLQFELGATKAFTVGFSGGGATNFQVALSSAAALLAANEKLTTALLVGADVTIPGNRVLHPADPVTIMGDAAGAVILRKGEAGSLLIDTELHSNGDYHDVCYIPGGALAHPDDPALYRMVLDKARYDRAPKSERLKQLLQTLLHRRGVRREEIVFALYPNLSAEDQQEFAEAMEFSPRQMIQNNLRSHGHLQGTDFVVNYLSMLQSGAVEKGPYFLAASHGMGFLAGVTLLQL